MISSRMFCILVLWIVLVIDLSSCKKEGKDESRSYPYALEFKELIYNPTQWVVLTANGYEAISSPTSATGFDDELESVLLDDNEFRLFNKFEFLSDSTVKIQFSAGASVPDTIMQYQVLGGKTIISFGSNPEEQVALYQGQAPNSLILGVLSTIYSYHLPDASVEYGPVEIQYSSETNVNSIINELRNMKNLTPFDTVGVNVAGYFFE